MKKKIISFILVFTIVLNLGMLCYANDNFNTIQNRQLIIDMYTNVNTEKDTYSTESKNIDSFTDKEIDKVEVYENNKSITEKML